MIIGIVGHEAAKFTYKGGLEARQIICDIINDPLVTEVCSGQCHLGGVDIWARQATIAAGKPFKPFPPKALNWEGYKARNLQIANYSNVVHNIVVDKLPPDFRGMTHKLCYHCGTTDHVKSGGCWTAKRAKEGIWHIVKQ